MSTRICWLVPLLLLLTSPASAQTFRVPSVDDKRATKLEITFQLFQTGSEDFSAFDGSEIEQDDTYGFGFGVAYNFTEHFALGFDFNWSEPDYDATVFRQTDEGLERIDISTESDIITGQIKGIWNFRKGRFTPYAELGAGLTYYDTNVSDGSRFQSCFWDPWLGWVCRSFTDTYDETNLSYGGGLGIRWESKDRLLLKLSYNLLNVEFDGPSDDPLFQTIKFEIGSRY